VDSKPAVAYLLLALLASLSIIHNLHVCEKLAAILPLCYHSFCDYMHAMTGDSYVQSIQTSIVM